MKIAIGSDHAAFELKEELKKYLSINQYEYKDFGAYNEESVDYPDYTEKVCEGILSGKFDRGVLLCGTGIGMSIAANKFKGIYAALADNTFSAETARKHNNSNVLVLPGRLIGKDLGKAILKIWLETEFEGGRHNKRLDKIKEIEKKI
ncbi:MAG TPA: ribose 5-phosphate isomerase B [Firmicutes bacterium]|nr:ribose 5-phosphate isomerase B [Bacillota bacterium]